MRHLKMKNKMFFRRLPKIRLNLTVLVASIFLAFGFTGNANETIPNQDLNINMQNVKVVDVLNEIEGTTTYRFIYNPEKIDIERKVSIIAKNDPISNVLSKIFAKTPVKYTLTDKYVILKVEPNSQRLTAPVMTGIQRSISGTVVDDQGTPLVGASVVLKGTTTGTTTDFDGNYSINADTGDVLLFSYIGQTSKEVTVGSSDIINVTLESGGVELEGVTMIGSRTKPRSDVNSAVPIDVVGITELNQTAQAEVAQGLHYSVPSFSAQKFGINDLAPLIDPAQLRGLGSDQTLLLINGKRRHKVSFFGGNDGVGKGQLGNDMNSVPGAAIKSVEILRDGAAAQYGSDAIAGVINYTLNNSSSGGSFQAYYGTADTNPKYDGIIDGFEEGENIYSDPVDDGQTYKASVNIGSKWGEDGFINTTLHFHKSEATDRSGTYRHSTGWYDDTQEADSGLTDEQLQAANGITSLDRAILGTAENTNGGVFVNAGKALNEKINFYAFGGVQKKQIIGGVFSRSPARDDRSNLDIFPNGYNPEVPSELTDFQVTSGFKGELGNDWSYDISGTYGGQDLSLFARNTINPSLPNSPTSFYTGGLSVTQSVLNFDMVKLLSERTSLAFGVETRGESYTVSQGEAASFQSGGIAGKDVGSSGREGFTDISDGKWRRNNIGLYAELDSDISDKFLVTVAGRLENYSDFGTDFSWKLASRYKISDGFALRGSINRSFRAPALAQTRYSNYSQISFDGAGDAIVSPTIPVSDPRYQSAFGTDRLKQETSFDLAGGLTAKFGNFTFTADAYSIKVDDRLFIATVTASDFAAFNNSGFDDINFFTNAIDTKTTGADIVLGYRSNFSDKSYLNLALAANFNKTEIDGINVTPELDGQLEFDRTANNSDAFIYLTEGTPRSKIIFTPTFKTGAFTFIGRISSFGKVTEPRLRYNQANDEWDDNPSGGGEPQVLASKAITDFTIVTNVTDNLTLTGSINNIFDVYPDMLREAQVRGEVIYSRRVNQFGTTGRFVSLALNYNW